MNLGESVWEIGTVIPRLTAQLVTLMQPCGTIFCSYKSTPKIFFIMLLCPYRSYIMSTPVPAHEGRRPEAVLKVERGLASRGCGLHHGLGRLGNRSPGTTTRAARSSLHVLRRKWRGRKRGTEAQNRHGKERREARVPDRKGTRGASQASRPAASLQAPVPRKHRASVGAPPTPHGVGASSRPGRDCVAGTSCVACWAV